MIEERLKQINLFDEDDKVFLQDFKYGVRVCTYCKKELPVTAFGTIWGKMKRSMCRGCFTKHAKIVEKLSRSAPPKPDNCQCCGTKIEIIPNKKKRSNEGVLQLDHEHGTEKFRGWVCNRCNVGLGKFGDNLKGIIKAALYLSNNNTDLILKALKNT